MLVSSSTVFNLANQKDCHKDTFLVQSRLKVKLSYLLWLFSCRIQNEFKTRLVGLCLHSGASMIGHARGHPQWDTKKGLKENFKESPLQNKYYLLLF